MKFGKALKAGFIVMLGTCITVSTGYAGKTANLQTDAEGTLQNVRVWTTYNDYSVLQDPSSMVSDTVIPPTVLSEGKDLSLSLTMGKGEREGVQIILTPKEDVASYTLKVNDLKMGDEVLAAEDMDVYKQCYVQGVPPIDNLSPYRYVPLGMYPDMLLPMDIATEYGETTIDAGMNQGISVEIESKADQAPGVYSGVFELTVDGKTQNIPVTATVRDVDLSKSYFKSSAASAGTLNDETYRMLMDEYRVLCQYPAGAAYSPETMLEKLDELWDNPHFISYDIPSSSYEVYYKYLYILAEASTPERNYLSRASCYVQAYDESADIVGIVKAMKEYRARKEKVMAKVDTFFPGEENAEWRAELKETIKNVTTYLTTNFWHKNIKVTDYQCDETWSSFCPIQAHPANFEQVMQQLSEESHQPMWVYCNSDWNAGISHNMPNYGTGMRSIGWFGAKYNIAGNLFWDIDSIRTFSEASKPTTEYKASRDYYRSALTFDTTSPIVSSANGDGVFIYPAIRYGQPEGWFGSIRLRNFRDGVEDHTLLTELEKLYEEKCSDYGLKNFDEIMRFVYDAVLGGDTSSDFNDGSVILKMRELLFDLYELAEGETRFALNGISFDKLTGTAEFFTQADSVTVNGKKLSSASGKYTVSFDLSSGTLDIALVKNGNTHTLKIEAFRYGTLVQADINAISASEIGKYAASSTGSFSGAVKEGTVSVSDGKIVYTIPAASGDVTDMLGYSPVFTLESKLFGCEDLYDKYYVQMKIRVKLNDAARGDQSLLISFAQNSLVNNEIKSVLFKKSDESPDGWRERTIIVKIARRQALECVKQLKFSFIDYHGNEYKGGATVEISDVVFNAGKYYN